MDNLKLNEFYYEFNRYHQSSFIVNKQDNKTNLWVGSWAISNGINLFYYDRINDRFYLNSKIKLYNTTIQKNFKFGLSLAIQTFLNVKDSYALEYYSLDDIMKEMRKRWVKPTINVKLDDNKQFNGIVISEDELDIMCTTEN